ncbi:MAG: hypothetical protein QM500_06250 [Methylococcales bacterium]
MLRKRITGLFVVFIYYPVTLFAVDVNYTTGLSYAQYDNINLLTQPPDEKETAHIVNVALTIVEDTSNFSTNVNTRLSATSYVTNQASDQTTGSFIANLNWKIKPGQFEWLLNNTFTQTVIDPLASNAPSNRQNVNVLSTGPDYTIRFNSRNNLEFDARIENYSFEQNRDNNRATVAARWRHRINSSVNVSLNNLAEIVEFEDEIANNNFHRNDVFLGLNYARALNTLEAQYGSTNITNDNIDDINYDRYLFAINKVNSRTSTMRFSYENRATDTGRLLLNSSATIIDGNPAVGDTASNDLFVDEIISAQYIKSLNRGGYTFQIYKTDREYNRQTNLDIDFEGVLISGVLNLQRGNSITYNLNYVNTLYKDPALSGREDEDYRYGLTYNFRLKRNASVGFSAISQERKSSDLTATYENLALFINLNYFSR